MNTNINTQDFYMGNYEDCFLSEVASESNLQLISVGFNIFNERMKNDGGEIVNTGKKLLNATGLVKDGKYAKNLKTLFSAKYIDGAKEEELRGFKPVDAIVRYGMYTDENGEVFYSALPKVVALLDADNRLIKLDGEARIYRGSLTEAETEEQ